MAPMVLLLHETPDGGSHFDWMLSRAAPDGGTLLTFRVTDRIDRMGGGAGGPDADRFRAERIGEHRRAYLEFEGELTGGRGGVVRIARGRCEVRESGGGEIVVRADWEGGTAVEWVGRPEGGGPWWVFERGARSRR